MIGNRDVVCVVRLPICAWLIRECTKHHEQMYTVPVTFRGTEDVGSGAIESPDGVIRLAYEDEPVTEAELLTYWTLSEREAEYDEYLEDVPDSTVVN
jgi:hypothetical protein